MTNAMRGDTQESPIELPDPRSDRKITFAHRLEYAGAVLLLRFFRVIGVDAASALCGKFLRFLGPKLRRLSSRAEINLRLAYPEWTDEEIHVVTAGVWENLGRTVGEIAHLDKFHFDGADPRLVHDGMTDDVARIIDGTTNAIFVAAHLANWEVAAVAAKRYGADFAIIYRALNNPLIDKMMIDIRARHMTRRQIPKGLRGALSAIDAIKHGKSIAMLADQKLNDGIAVPFFGHDAKTTPAAARFALKNDLPILFIGAERLKGARFKMNAYPIEIDPTGDLAADTRALTAAINKTLEDEIRRRPAQWLWLHRRWPKATYDLLRAGAD